MAQSSLRSPGVDSICSSEFFHIYNEPYAFVRMSQNNVRSSCTWAFPSITLCSNVLYIYDNCN